MAEIVQQLPMPLEIPEDAFRRCPFLDRNSFVLGDRSPPGMPESGEVQCCIHLVFLLLILASVLAETAKGLTRSRRTRTETGRLPPHVP
eukprot:2515214-Pyramimonas_sp.AAC.1